MIQRLFRIIFPFIMLLASVLPGYAAAAEETVSTASAGKLNIQLYDGRLLNSDTEVITGRIEPWSEITASTTLYSGETEAVSYSVYIGVYSDDRLAEVGKSDVQTIAAGSVNQCSVKCRIP